MRFFRPVNLLTGLFLTFAVLFTGMGQASASGSFIPFVPADGSTVADSVYGRFCYPNNIAVDSSGNVYVADTFNHRVQKFTSDGAFVTAWGGTVAGSVYGQFDFPNGVAVDSGGNVYVADTYNHRIQKFTSDGAFVIAWGTGFGDGQLDFPRGVAVDSSGSVYVVDLNNRVQKFDSDGDFITKWGIGGSGDGQFDYPYDVAVDSSGYVYVADSENHRVQKFDSDGDFVTAWGSGGSGDGQFENPTGVAVDSSGYVYVVDSENHRVQKFDSDGSFVTKWGSYGNSYGQFFCPSGVGVGGGDNVYVADTVNCRIQVLAPILEATSTVKGQTIASLGTPSILMDSVTAGSVTITAAQAADTTEAAPYATLFESNYQEVTVKAVKYAAGESTGSFDTDAAYAGDAISNGDFFIIRLKAADNTPASYYKIVVTVNGVPVIQSATAGDGLVTIEWSLSPLAGVTKFNVYMSTTPGSYGAAMATLTGSIFSYYAPGLDNGTTYYFVVTATNNGIESVYSNEVSATPRQSGGGGGGGGGGGSTALAITTSSLAAGTAGQPYEQVITTNGAGTRPYTFNVTTGSLPPGLELDASTGMISGAPVTAGTYDFTVTVKDDKNKNAGKSYTLTVGAAAVTPVTLTDIAGHWAEKNIKKLVEAGVAGGYPDGTFRPDNTITRAEFATLLVKALKLEPGQGKLFADTAGHWAKGTISTAAAWEIISGYSDSEFGPDDPVTREQMAVMVANVLKLSPSGEELSFSDSADISAWAKEAVAAVVEGGIMNGYPDSSFRPQGSATRAEAVTVIVNVLG